jgi:hypothetical protein
MEAIVAGRRTLAAWRSDITPIGAPLGAAALRPEGARAVYPTTAGNTSGVADVSLLPAEARAAA